MNITGKASDNHRGFEHRGIHVLHRLRSPAKIRVYAITSATASNTGFGRSDAAIRFRQYISADG
jgi:hypothetical protein